MAETNGEKKHPASDRKRHKAREDGQVVKSQDLTSAAMLMAAVLVLMWFGRGLMDKLAAATSHSLAQPSFGSFSVDDANSILLQSAAWLAMIALPLLLSMMLAGVAINISQVGLLFSTTKLMPKLSHISPLAGIKRIFSLQGVMRLAFGLGKVLVIAVVACLSLVNQQDRLVAISAMELPILARTLFDCLIETSLWIAGALLLIAILEYAYQWWKFEQDLRMTDQEVRDEMKESEGDPQMNARRRQIQRQMVTQRIASEVPSADVVVTNPTELAIAIRYDPETMEAPMVVAKGAGNLAQRIRRLALEHEIPIVERKPLAQVLYKTVDVGQVIPLEHYQAVAEVLRYVYQLQGRKLPAAV